jgi:hypothetical protein
MNNPLRFIDPDGMEPEGIAASFLDTDLTWGGASYLMYNPIEPKRDKNPPAVAAAAQNTAFYSFNSRAQSRREQMAGDQQGGADPRDPIIVHVMNEIVGYTIVKSYKYRSSDVGGIIVFRVPLYKVVVTGQTEDGTRVMKTFQAVRFGVQRNSTGEPFMQGINTGSFPLSAKNGKYHIDGGMSNDLAYIHAGNISHDNVPAGGPNSYIGCIGISGVLEWTSFKKTMGQLGFGDVSSYVIFHDATTPPLVDSGLRWKP